MNDTDRNVAFVVIVGLLIWCGCLLGGIGYALWAVHS